jgi:streptomycin 6-kinase
VAKGLVHPGLEWLRESREGSTRLERLPLLLRECAEQWSLRVGDAYPYASASLAVPATLPDGGGAVLKVQFSDRKSEFEAAALVRWDGDGAVRLLAHDAGRHALLLERCDPGTPLSELDQDDALDVIVSLLPRLWKPVGGPFRSLVDEAAWWAGYLPAKWARSGHPFQRGLLDAVLDALELLPRSQGEQVLVNQDLHADNVLRARREPWLVIDPKPLAGEREFGVAAIVRGDELGEGAANVRHRLNRLTAELGLDRDRTRAWAMAQTLAWAVGGDDDEGEWDEGKIETARSLLDA